MSNTRPSAVVIRRFVLAQQGRDTRDRTAVADTRPNTTKSKKPNGTAVDDHHGKETRGEAGNGGKIDAKMVAAGEKGGTENEGGARGRGRGRGREGVSLASPAWLLSSLPFHDDDTFTRFFADVLLSSERLARRLY